MNIEQRRSIFIQILILPPAVSPAPRGRDPVEPLKLRHRRINFAIAAANQGPPGRGLAKGGQARDLHQFTQWLVQIHCPAKRDFAGLRLARRGYERLRREAGITTY
ncbi:MAG: hypothetical protein ABSB91_05455 [Sedimentisphaerales bacterium]